MRTKLASVKDIIEDLREQRMVILVDDERRENEGDLVIAASIATPDHINFMATHGRGLICLAMGADNIDRLGLPLMTHNNNCNLGTAFTVSIDARDNTTTGISAYDRSHTVRLAADPQSSHSDFRIPGHIFPLRARKGGVLERAGHTEASVELSRLAGFSEAAVICEIMKDDGTMSRLPDLVKFAEKHNLHIASISDISDYLIQKRSAA
jgi:3,4-dihydroxy 2-butanone 4-phosphate synthase/GTP cyclohydrolase II